MLAAALNSVVDVRLAAYRRVAAELKTSRARLDASKAKRRTCTTHDEAFPVMMAEERTYEFTRQLRASADSLAADYTKACNDVTDAEAKHNQKLVKLFEDASLDLAREEAEDLLLDTCL